MDAKIGPKKAILVTFFFGIFSLGLNLVGGLLNLAGKDQVATVLMFAAQPFLGILLGGAANYLVSLVSTIWGRYDFDQAYRVLKPLVAIIGAMGITICGGLGNTVGYTYAYLVLEVLAVAATIIIVFVNDGYVGYKAK